MSTETVDLSYEPFSREPEYIEVNRHFIESLNLTPYQCILDLACGTGTVTVLICDYTQPMLDARREAGIKTNGTIIGVDLSQESLAHAQAYLLTHGFLHRRHVRLARASADSLPLPDCSFDVVIVGNAIQLFEDKERVVSEVNRVLRPGGLFAFNTSFYVGTYVPGTEGVYVSWVEEAVRYLMRKDEDSKRLGLPRVRRKKGVDSQPAFSRPWLSLNEYEQLIERHGFEVQNRFERIVKLNRSNLETIGSFAGLASVLLKGYPIRLACEGLERSAGPALAAAGLDAVPRRWLELVARKK